VDGWALVGALVPVVAAVSLATWALWLVRWIVLIGVVVYVAVTLADRPGRDV